MDVTVRVEPTAFKDGGDEVTCVRIEIEDDNGTYGRGEDGLCLDGANERRERTRRIRLYRCALRKPGHRLHRGRTHIRNPRTRKQYGISHVDVYARAFDTDRYGTGDDCVKDAGEPVS